jgi:quercetin dioxygenase-like cupin family protein
MENPAIKNPGRRNFLRTAPVAAGLALADASLLASHAAAQGATPVPSSAFQLLTAETLEDDVRALQANPGNNNLAGGANFAVVLTVEKAKSAKEFEWHEHRDHIFQVLDGSTVYELGGTPKNGRSIRPGEWLATDAEGAQKLTLKKGDMLVIPRGTPHRRTTAQSVTLTLISPQNP